MRTLKLTIEYDGTDFNGWQIQKHRKDRTVQGEIERALRKIFGKPVSVHGSGRTDAGVHARGQVAHIQLSSVMPPEEIVRALNGNLPRDICVLSAVDVPETFHARYGAKRKVYRYQVLNRRPPPALDRRFVWHYPYKLNVPVMKKAARFLVGRHDFAAFCAADPLRRGRDTVREIYDIQVKKSRGMICFDLEANGFLYKMVRNIVGTLVAVGGARLSPEGVKAVLRAKDRNIAAETAPAAGLVLQRVYYTERRPEKRARKEAGK